MNVPWQIVYVPVRARKKIPYANQLALILMATTGVNVQMGIIFWIKEYA